MKNIIAITALAFVLAACSTSTTTTVTSAVDTACNDLAFADAAFQAYAAFRPVNKKVTDAEAVAYAGGAAACAARSSGTLAVVTASLNAIAKAKASL